MATKTQKRGRSGNPLRRADQLAEAAVRRAPRCECRHTNGKCRRVARFRVSELCQVDDCRTAVRVRLACAVCKDGWMDHARRCHRGHRLRVTAL